MGHPVVRRYLTVIAAGFMLALPATRPVSAAPVAHGGDGGISITQDRQTITLRPVAINVLQVHVSQAGAPPQPEPLVIDPQSRPKAVAPGKLEDTAQEVALSTPGFLARWDKATGTLTLATPAGKPLLTQADTAALASGRIVLTHAASDPIYGIRGYFATEPSQAGLLRHGVQVAKSGEQGYAGAPFAWSTAGFGVLVDARPARFNLDGSTLTADGFPKGDFTYYLITGTPPEIFSALSRLSGPAPIFPKWAMGFINSQFGIDQAELLDIVKTYRQKQIPIDNMTLDFDWKGWSEDNYGEFRWNDKKFPDGPSGRLKAQLDAQGIKLAGIMKPRILVDSVQGRYARDHHLWFDAKPALADYFSLKLVRDLDFNKPETRQWFFNDTLKHSFDTGIVGWWNDEADDTGDDYQFMNMQRSLYEGQRAYSQLRVWSLNRNFYLGSQRYAYGMWSGDIDTGFDSMASQRERMLSAISLGEWKWGMDGGGFVGRPSDENYARWIEFGAFTPIFRVHGSLAEKRQPWRYGPVAEAAATRAIRLRYALIPYIYSYEHATYASGVGLVRPLPFEFPTDANVRNAVDSWMFGQYLLVSPVVTSGQIGKQVYLPEGRWTGYFDGKVYEGGRSINLAVDAKTWSDIPLFIREGAIIPSQAPVQYVGQIPLLTVDVDVFPADGESHFNYYDDNGTNYNYEKGEYFAQELSTHRSGKGAVFATGPRSGKYKLPLKYYLVKVHGVTGKAVAGLALRKDEDTLRATDGPGWATGKDTYGEVTYLKLPAGRPGSWEVQP
jgi:alpha-glucosidase (family GH31 glycosyl hydrolase)